MAKAGGAAVLGVFAIISNDPIIHDFQSDKYCENGTEYPMIKPYDKIQTMVYPWKIEEF